MNHNATAPSNPTPPSREDLLRAVEVGEQPVFQRSLIVDAKEFDDGERTITAYCTTVDRDRYGDTIQPSGMQNANYRNNPVILWAHNYAIPPIAKSLWEKPDARGVRICMQFDSRDEAMEIYRLYREGYLNAFSIGFLPVAFERVFENNLFTGLNFTEWELIECSAVPVPANPNALQDAFEHGLVKSERLLKCLDSTSPDFHSYLARKQAPIPENDGRAEVISLTQKLEMLHNQLSEAARRFDEAAGLMRSLGVPETGNAVPQSTCSTKPFDPSSLIEEVARKELRRLCGRIS